MVITNQNLGNESFNYEDVAMYRKYGWSSADCTPAHKYLLPRITTLIPQNVQRILDAGCGNGYLAGKLADLGYEVIGIDIAEDGIAIAKERYPAQKFLVASVYDDLLPMIGPVDLVVSSEVIEHLYYPKSFLLNMYRVIRPNGWIILTTPYHGYLKNLLLSILNYWDKHFTVDWEGGHIKFFSPKTLGKLLLETGFTDLRFCNAGRMRWLWKSMVCRAQKKRQI